MSRQGPQEISIEQYRALATKGGDRKRQKRSAPNVPHAAPAPRDGLSTMLVKGWSIAVDARGVRLYRINGASTGWCKDEAAAVVEARGIENIS